MSKPFFTLRSVNRTVKHVNAQIQRLRFLSKNEPDGGPTPCLRAVPVGQAGFGRGRGAPAKFRLAAGPGACDIAGPPVRAWGMPLPQLAGFCSAYVRSSQVYSQAGVRSLGDPRSSGRSGRVYVLWVTHGSAGRSGRVYAPRPTSQPRVISRFAFLRPPPQVCAVMAAGMWGQAASKR